MPGTPNLLIEMGCLNTVVDSKDERPNPSFEGSALPGFKKTVQSRRAVRAFDTVSIPEDIMRDCLRDATLAPSSSNLQCYELYWVRDDEKKKLLADLCLGHPRPVVRNMRGGKTGPLWSCKHFLPDVSDAEENR